MGIPSENQHQKAQDTAKQTGKVVLAYSGGLDTSVILKWLSSKGFEVICYCANVGQQGEDFAAVKAKALSLGASKVYIEDLRKDFITSYIFPSVQADGMYEDTYLLGTSLARPIISKRHVEIAQLEKAKFLAHGATGKGNDQVRFELCAQALDSTLTTIAPWREADFIEQFKGRSDLMAYAAAKHIPIDATPKAPYSTDENLYHTSYEAGMLEDPMTKPMKSMFKMTADPRDAPEDGTKVRVHFDQGVPTEVEQFGYAKGSAKGKRSFSDEIVRSVKDDPLALFLYLNQIAGENGIGRIDIVENRFVGIKSRGVYETPGGTLLRHAHIDLQGLTMDREVKKVHAYLSKQFAEYAYNGFWFSPEMDLVKHAIAYSQRNVTGFVDVELYKGNLTVVGRSSPNPLYFADLASMEIEHGAVGVDYEPKDAQGFIRINATRLKAYSLVEKKREEKEKTEEKMEVEGEGMESKTKKSKVEVQNVKSGASLTAM